MNPMQAVLASRVAQQQQRAGGAIAVVQAAKPQVTPAVQPSQHSAQDCFQHLQRSTTECRNAMMEIAYYGYRLRLANSWEEIGFADEQTCHDYLGIPAATWDKYISIGERLANLSLADLRSLSLVAAQWLTRVNPKLWDEFDWVAEARLLSSTDFAALVAQRNNDRRLLSAKSAVAQPNEGQVEFKFPIPPSHLRPFKQRLEKIRQGYDVRSVAEALELALAAAEHELAREATEESIDAGSSQEISPSATSTSA